MFFKVLCFWPGVQSSNWWGHVCQKSDVLRVYVSKVKMTSSSHLPSEHPRLFPIFCRYWIIHIPFLSDFLSLHISDWHTHTHIMFTLKGACFLFPWVSQRGAKRVTYLIQINAWWSSAVFKGYTDSTFFYQAKVCHNNGRKATMPQNIFLRPKITFCKHCLLLTPTKMTIFRKNMF